MAFGPVRVDGGFDRELKRGAAVAICGIDEGAVGDQFRDDFGTGAPCSHMKGRVVFRNTEVAIALAIESGYADVRILQIADARNGPHAYRRFLLRNTAGVFGPILPGTGVESMVI